MTSFKNDTFSVYLVELFRCKSSWTHSASITRVSLFERLVIYQQDSSIACFMALLVTSFIFIASPIFVVSAAGEYFSLCVGFLCVSTTVFYYCTLSFYYRYVEKHEIGLLMMNNTAIGNILSCGRPKMAGKPDQFDGFQRGAVKRLRGRSTLLCRRFLIAYGDFTEKCLELLNYAVLKWLIVVVFSGVTIAMVIGAASIELQVNKVRTCMCCANDGVEV